MTDPHEIIEEALANAHDLDMTDALYAKAIVRKLEAAGYVIVDPDQVTDEMIFAARRRNPRIGISAALRAAPKWTKGSEG